jgi:DNA (cytosine-5)-methyltransferase 1
MKRLTFGSVCSGIEAASVAWVPLGFEALWLSEIEPYPSHVLRERYPSVPNLGNITAPDFLDRARSPGTPDIVVGGTPCQAFSVAGLRRGLADRRGNLTLRYVEICDAIHPVVCVWENVPGVLSSDDNAFGCFLGALVGADWPLEPGPRPAVGKSARLWRWHRSGGRHIPRWPGAGFCIGPGRRAAWRILDAQHFGVPQRRRRVFVVACAGTSGIDPAEILFEREGVSGDSAPGSKAGQGASGGTARGARGPGARVAPTLPSRSNSGGGMGTDFELDGGLIAHALSARHDSSEDGTGRGIPLVSAAVTAKWAKGCGGPSGDECQNLVPWSHVPPLAFDCKNDPAASTVSPPLRAMGHHGSHPNAGGQVAVVTPLLEPGSRTGVSTNDPRCGDGIGSPGDPMFTLQATRQHGVMVHWAQGGGEVEDETAGTLRAGAEHCYQFLRQTMGVRRLTPRECERLQGFQDDHTLVAWGNRSPKDYRDMVAYLIASGWPEERARELAKTPDGHRYKAAGNSMAVPVMRWIGMRIREAMKDR